MAKFRQIWSHWIQPTTRSIDLTFSPFLGGKAWLKRKLPFSMHVARSSSGIMHLSLHVATMEILLHLVDVVHLSSI